MRLNKKRLAWGRKWDAEKYLVLQRVVKIWEKKLERSGQKLPTAALRGVSSSSSSSSESSSEVGVV